MALIISISLKPELRDQLDVLADREQRSRSYVVSEAIREYIARKDREKFSAARERTLKEGLSLTPAERLRLSEELWSEFSHARKPVAAWKASFRTFDEYDAWRRQNVLVGA